MPEVERMNESDLDALVRKRWRAQAEYVRTRSDFYRAHKFTGDLEELADLDFTDKEMLREDQRLNPPFGSYLASTPDHVSRVHRTSGSTGAQPQSGVRAMRRPRSFPGVAS